MKICICFFVVLCAIITDVIGTSDSVQPDMDFPMHFKALSRKRYPFYNHGDPWLDARRYVKEKMRHYGVRDIREQKFNTTVEGTEIEGVNLIGIAQGRTNNTNGSVIVVGADYDTNLAHNQLKDNAGGVAVLLETMHLFFDRVYWNQYFQNFTVIFVAFDLNTREYRNSSMGQPGSFHFVHDWLLPYLNNKSYPQDFQGAIILDSITTYNVRNGTQHLREGFEEALPKAYNDITSRGSAGNFLGFLYTSSEEPNPIRRTFVQEYNLDRKMRPFRLQEMEIHISTDLIGDDVLNMMNHQSHYYFWTNVVNRYLPAFLLFDTDDDRVDPTPDACGAIECSVDEFLTKERINFLTKTTQTLVSTLLKLQSVYIPEFPNSAATYSSSVVLMLTTWCILMSLLFKRL